MCLIFIIFNQIVDASYSVNYELKIMPFYAL